jgi:hypothetical protein
MESIDTLKRPQLLKELQNHKKYQNKTQKEITEKLGGVVEMRKELKKLKDKKEKIIIIKGKSYTEDELYEIIKAKENDKIDNDKIEPVNLIKKKNHYGIKIYDVYFFNDQTEKYDDEKIIYKNDHFTLWLDNDGLGKIVIDKPVELTLKKLLDIIYQGLKNDDQLMDDYMEKYGKHSYINYIKKKKNGDYYINYD